MDEIEIVGPLGTLRFSCFTEDSPVFTSFEGAQEPLDHAPQPEHVHYPIVCSIAEDILKWKESGSLEQPQTSATGAAAARTNAVLDAVLGSYYAGRSIEPPYWLRPGGAHAK
mmetsp:Transcript_16795/g.63927  ORF Transcript_16795/g.63927 Transcript_16795/m.63927 type:complete len:112 (-) Transcript_16795:76-411(-)